MAILQARKNKADLLKAEKDRKRLEEDARQQRMVETAGRRHVSSLLPGSVFYFDYRWPDAPASEQPHRVCVLHRRLINPSAAILVLAAFTHVPPTPGRPEPL